MSRANPGARWSDAFGTRFRNKYGGERHRYVQPEDIRDDVLEYHGEGNSAEEIADELGVSVQSVRKVLETSE